MMRYMIFILMAFVLGCDDGDLEIKEIDFDEVALGSCSTMVNTAVLFKVKESESLVLVLQNGLLQNVAGQVSSAVPSQSQFYYRFFDDQVSSSYFCSAVPPASPVVEKEIEATGGVLIITTVEEDLGGGISTYRHTITIENLILTNENAEQLVATNFELGTFMTN